MRIELVTFQGKHVRLWLANQRIYRARWHRGDRSNPWDRSYAWMSEQMSRRGIPTGAYPPIWAWPNAREFGGPPTYGTAYSLLSEIELERGIWVMDLSVPSRYCLRSCYRLWNTVLYEFIDGKLDCEVPPGLFETPVYRHRAPLEPDDIQFCLPFIDRSWVRGVRPLPNRPNIVDWDRVI